MDFQYSPLKLIREGEGNSPPLPKGVQGLTGVGFSRVYSVGTGFLLLANCPLGEYASISVGSTLG